MRRARPPPGTCSRTGLRKVWLQPSARTRSRQDAGSFSMRTGRVWDHPPRRTQPPGPWFAGVCWPQGFPGGSVTLAHQGRGWRRRVLPPRAAPVTTPAPAPIPGQAVPPCGKLLPEMGVPPDSPPRPTALPVPADDTSWAPLPCCHPNASQDVPPHPRAAAGSLCPPLGKHPRDSSSSSQNWAPPRLPTCGQPL